MSIPPPLGPPGAHFEALGVTAEVLRRVLQAALARGGDDCDLYFEHTGSTAVALSDGKVNQAATQVDLGMGVRVLLGDQVGYAYSEDLDPAALVAAARTAGEIAAGSRSVPPVAAALRTRSVPDHYPVTQPWDSVGMDTRVALVRAWEQDTFRRDPRILRVRAVLRDASRVVMVVRADGQLTQDFQPMTVAQLACTAEQGGQRESNSSSLAGRAGLELYTEAAQDRLATQTVERTLFLLDAGPPPAGEMPVVLAAGASAILLHEAIGHGMEADFNRKRISLYASRMGQRVAADDVTIVDDATLPGARGSINVDDEGSPTERTVLVEGGILRSYLHDRISARHYGVDPTGSGRREGFRHAPLPRMRSTYMEPGPTPPEEILRSVDRGLYCQTFANGQVDIGGGDFAFYMKTGWLIEGGRLTRPVKDANIIGNGPAVLAGIDRVGDDLAMDEGGWTCGKDGQSVPVSQGMPTVRVAKLVVGGVGT